MWHIRTAAAHTRMEAAHSDQQMHVARLVAVAAVEAHYDLILLPRPGAALDVGVQVVVPPARV